MCMEKSEILNLITKVLGDGAEIISPLVGGMMNISYIVKDKDNKKYVLYISTEQANEMVNRPLEKEHQRIVYELGITSKNVYFDAEKGISKSNCQFPLNRLIVFFVCTCNKRIQLCRTFKQIHSSVCIQFFRL